MKSFRHLQVGFNVNSGVTQIKSKARQQQIYEAYIVRELRYSW